MKKIIIFLSIVTIILFSSCQNTAVKTDDQNENSTEITSQQKNTSANGFGGGNDNLVKNTVNSLDSNLFCYNTDDIYHLPIFKSIYPIDPYTQELINGTTEDIKERAFGFYEAVMNEIGLNTKEYPLEAIQKDIDNNIYQAAINDLTVVVSHEFISISFVDDTFGNSIDEFESNKYFQAIQKISGLSNTVVDEIESDDNISRYLIYTDSYIISEKLYNKTFNSIYVSILPSNNIIRFNCNMIEQVNSEQFEYIEPAEGKAFLISEKELSDDEIYEKIDIEYSYDYVTGLFIPVYRIAQIHDDCFSLYDIPMYQ